jgi:hypothetical protein
MFYYVANVVEIVIHRGERKAMTSSDFDFDIVDPTATESSAPTYPIVQWHNGQQSLKALGGVQYTGGLVLPLKYLSNGFAIPNWTPTQMTFRSGKEESALTTQKAVITPIRSRFRWFVNHAGVVTYFPRNAYTASSNMRGHLQVLAALQGLDEPVVITFKGKASQTFESLLKDFTARVVQLANRHAPKGRTLPRYAFWMTLAPSPHTKAGNSGQEAVVTLPSLALSLDLTLDYARSVYVGRDNLIRFQDWYRQAEPWATEWEKTGTGSADTVSEFDEDTEPEHQLQMAN